MVKKKKKSFIVIFIKILNISSNITKIFFCSNMLNKKKLKALKIREMNPQERNSSESIHPRLNPLELSKHLSFPLNPSKHIFQTDQSIYKLVIKAE